MKNRRDVCLAKDAGFIQYPGLPGHIKSGCMATPAFKSRYCSEHSVRVCSISEGHSMQDNPCNQPSATPSATLPSGREQAVVEMLLEKKVTRSTTYYKVYTCGGSFA